MGINDDDDDGNDEPDKIPTHHLGFCPLGFCPLGFILHTMMMMTVMMMMKQIIKYDVQIFTSHLCQCQRKSLAFSKLAAGARSQLCSQWGAIVLHGVLLLWVGLSLAQNCTFTPL